MHEIGPKGVGESGARLSLVRLNGAARDDMELG